MNQTPRRSQYISRALPISLTGVGQIYNSPWQPPLQSWDQGIKAGQEAQQEEYFNDRYLENSIIYQQTFSPDKYPGHFSVELYIILITYPPTVQ